MDFPGGPVAKTLHVQCVCVCTHMHACVCLEAGVGWGLGSIPGWRARFRMPQRKIPHMAMKIEDPACCNDLLEKGMAIHSIFAWEIPWTEEPGRLQAIGSQRVR